jgi:hypothetical protein
MNILRSLLRSSGLTAPAFTAVVLAASSPATPVATTIGAAPPAAPAAPVSREPVSTKIDGETLFAVGFDKLAAFPYTIVDAGTGATPEEIAVAQKRDQVPDWIRIYHDKRVVLTGYMMPLQVENGKSRKFVMMKDVNTCCYGAVPNMNDYAVVTMKGDGIAAVQDVPVLLVGVLKVEEKYESGYITALFQMEGEKFLGPAKK